MGRRWRLPIRMLTVLGTTDVKVRRLDAGSRRSLHEAIGCKELRARQLILRSHTGSKKAQSEKAASQQRSGIRDGRPHIREST